MKIGILGGTFDPLHNGHLWIAEHALAEYGLDELWLMPAGNPYFKEGKNVTDAAVRFEMTALGVSGRAQFRVSDFELSREGKTFTSETLRLLSGAYPEHRFYFIIGEDSLLQLPNWHAPEVLFRHAVILCARRAGSREEISAEIAALNLRFQSAGADIREIHCEELPVSSTMIRGMIAEGEDVSRLLPENVLRYITEKKLYQSV